MDEISWSVTLDDIKYKLKIKVGLEQAKIFQDYQTMAAILSQAFGGKSKEVEPPKTKQEALSQFNSLFGQKK
jgi:hypothetical protein